MELEPWIFQILNESKRKDTAYGRVSGPYDRISTKIEPIKTLGFSLRPAYLNIKFNIFVSSLFRLFHWP